MSKESPEKIAERYRVISRLGTGRSGIVYEAQDTVLSKVVALKLLNVQVAEARDVVRFQNEARAAAKLKHKNIVTVYDFNRDDKDNFYLVLEFIHGMSLMALIEQEGEIEAETCLPLLIQILDGLAHAHEHGVIHRDLNPNNVLIDMTDPDDSNAKIVDFGLAWLGNQDQRLTREGVGVGTPEYMSPEQCRGQEADARSDIYSFGCLAFKALTGKTPHRGDTALDTIMLHLNQDAPTMAGIRPDIEWEHKLTQIIGKALQREPAQRYQTAKAMAADLRALYDNAQENDDATTDVGNQSDLKQPSTLGSMNADRKNFSLVAFAIVLIAGLAVGVYMLGRQETNVASEKERQAIAKPTNAQKKSTKRKKANRELIENEPPTENGGLQSRALEYLGSPVFISDVKAPKLISDSSGNWVIDPCIDDENAAVLKGHRNIKMLSLKAAVYFKGPGLKYLRGLPLIFLDIRKSMLDDNGLKYLPPLPNLQKLFLSDNQIQGENLDCLKKFHKLKELDLSSNPIVDQSLVNIAGLESLERVLIDKCPKLTGATLGSLAKLPKLNELAIGQSNIQPHYLDVISTFPTLRQLSIKKLNLRAKDLGFVHRSKLDFLYLDRNPLTDEDLEFLSKSKTLYHLSICQCSQITSKGLKYLVDSPLKSLDVSGNKLDEESLRVLTGAPNLKHLLIMNCGLSEGQRINLVLHSKIDMLTLNSIGPSEAALKKRFPKRSIIFLGLY